MPSNGPTFAQALIEVYYSNCIKSMLIYKSCINFKYCDACYEYFNLFFGLQVFKVQEFGIWDDERNTSWHGIFDSTTEHHRICQWIQLWGEVETAHSSIRFSQSVHHEKREETHSTLFFLLRNVKDDFEQIKIWVRWWNTFAEKNR